MRNKKPTPLPFLSKIGWINRVGKFITLIYFSIFSIHLKEYSNSPWFVWGYLLRFYIVLASEHTLTCVLRGSSIFWVKINNLNPLYFAITTFSNHKISKGVMKKIFHPQMHNTHQILRHFMIRKCSNTKL